MEWTQNSDESEKSDKIRYPVFDIFRNEDSSVIKIPKLDFILVFGKEYRNEV